VHCIFIFIYCVTRYFFTLVYVITHLLMISALTDMRSLHCMKKNNLSFIFSSGKEKNIRSDHQHADQPSMQKFGLNTHLLWKK